MIELKPIKLWTEKSIQFPDGTLRIYIGNVHIGTAKPSRTDGDLYSFSTNYIEIINETKGNYVPLSDILLEIELSLKEFISKITIKQIK